MEDIKKIDVYTVIDTHKIFGVKINAYDFQINFKLAYLFESALSEDISPSCMDSAIDNIMEILKNNIDEIKKVIENPLQVQKEERFVYRGTLYKEKELAEFQRNIDKNCRFVRE